MDASGARPLHMAAARGHKELVEWLLKWGVDAEAVDEDGWTPLHFACMKAEAYETALALVQNQVPHSPADKKGVTPLHVACAHAAGESARMLMRMGADAELKDKGGRAALDLCEGVAPQWPASRGAAGAAVQQALSEMRMTAGHKAAARKEKEEAARKEKEEKERAKEKAAGGKA